MNNNVYILKNNYYLGLSIYRIILSFILLKNFIFFLPISNLLFGESSIYPLNLYQQSLSLTFLNSTGLPHFVSILFSIPIFPKIYLFICIIFSSLFILGVGRNVIGIILYLLTLNLMWLNPYILDGSDNVIQVTMPFLVLSNSFKYFTWNNNNIYSTLDDNSRNKNSLTLYQSFIKNLNDFSILGIQIQVCFIYFFTAVAKMQGALWLNGTAIYYTMRVADFQATELNIPLTQNHYFVVIATYSTVIWELAFIFLVWFKNTKKIVLLFGCLLHIGIWIFMRIDNFSWIMIGTYFVFLTDFDYQNILNKISQWNNYFRIKIFNK